ncbi:hypothetical protein CRV24_000244 [Beauveria bassiana]|nr:hypothetical protein CRV24_000244 [Beauveria bassiana]KAH8721235.1 hypothetical protein HC256_001595 [Beauveria bassiana]
MWLIKASIISALDAFSMRGTRRHSEQVQNSGTRRGSHSVPWRWRRRSFQSLPLQRDAEYASPQRSSRALGVLSSMMMKWRLVKN